jgi:hypothetical protein
MITMLEVGVMHYPQIRCDGCGEPIEDASDAHALFAIQHQPVAMNPVYHCHSGGCRQAVMEHVLGHGHRPGQTSLTAHLAQLALNCQAFNALGLPAFSGIGPNNGGATRLDIPRDPDSSELA